jgi:hypothetical protein
MRSPREAGVPTFNLRTFLRERRTALVATVLLIVGGFSSFAHAESPTRFADPALALALHRLDKALAVGNISVAERSWHDAYSAALASRRWEALIQVGDASLRIGMASRERKVGEARARQLYLSALFRARSQRSVDGVLRATEAFALLGDHAVVEQGLRMAEQLAVQIPEVAALEQVRAFRARWAGGSVGARSTEVDPPGAANAMPVDQR